MNEGNSGGAIASSGPQGGSCQSVRVGKSWLNENTGAGSGSLLASLPQLLHPEGPEMNVPVS